MKLKREKARSLMVLDFCKQFKFVCFIFVCITKQIKCDPNLLRNTDSLFLVSWLLSLTESYIRKLIIHCEMMKFDETKIKQR